MEDYMNPYIVYVKLDERNLIADVNSSAFPINTDAWTEIDCGYGDKYHHAQGNYFDQPIYDDRSIKQYKAVTVNDAPEGEIIAEFVKDGVTYWIFERTQEEMDADYAARPAPPPSDKERIKALEEELIAAKILLGLEV